LIDSDVIQYEIGFAAETAWKHASPNSDDPPPWDFVEELLLRRIDHIEHECEATLPSIFFFTGNGNFRNELAKRCPYKQRPSHKPYHYKNIKAFIQGNFESRLQDGLEADDLISIEQTIRGDETIICTRDKDLRSVDGWHFGWELGKQPSFGPLRVDGYGTIFLSDDRKKLSGYGLKFFLSQCLTGDRVDSIPGLAGCGPVAAFEALADTNTYTEGLQAVLEAYTQSYGLDCWTELREQGRLLWMTRKLHDDGSPVLWELDKDYQ
jgi:hypothetical protein